MKLSNLSKVAGASLLSLSLAVLPASAQNNTAPSRTDSTAQDTNRTAVVDNERGDRDFDWGWLGLLGLIGLAGLARPKREESVRYREPEEAGRSGTRY